MLNLYNLPEVVNIFIESDYFDNKRQACAHVTKNARPVTVKLGDKTQVLCVSCCIVLLCYVHGKHLRSSGQSFNLTTLFLGRLRPPKQLTSTSCTYFRQ